MKKHSLSLKLPVYILWLGLSFYAVYYFIASASIFPSWRFASTAFTWYILTIFPISIIAAYFLTRHHISDILQRVRVLISLASILLVISFTLIQWTTLTTRYGNIESFRMSGAANLELSYEQEKLMSVFEKEQLYHQTVVSNYDIVFKKILTFYILIIYLCYLSLQCCKGNTKN